LGDHGGRPSAEEDLRDLPTLSPSFQRMVAPEYKDLVTPYANSRYVLDHIPSSDPAP
jgi:hypothetical protein